MTSRAAHAVAVAETSEEVFVDLLTFTAPGLETPIRLSSDDTEILSYDGPIALFGTRSRGAGRVGPDADDPVHVFTWLGFEVQWPGYREEATPEVRVTLPLLDRGSMLGILRQHQPERVRCLVERVISSDPDTVVDRAVGFFLRKAPWTDSDVQLVLQLTRYDLEPYPVGEMTPDAFPGLFP
jgi:hypothetical protein